MKVLIADSMSKQALEVFKKFEEIEVDVKTGLSPEELKKIIKDYDGLAIRSATKVTEDLIDAAPKLKVIGRAGIGVDNVDIPAATKKGIVVMNTPLGNANAAAEHAIALMLSLARHIPQANASMKEGKWEKKKFMGIEVMDKTLGIIGLGNIGSIVASRASGLKMNIIAYDPFLSEERAKQKGVELVSLDELFAKSDFITIHTPLTPETKNMINKDTFAKMKDGVMIINCARGGIVNEKDLCDAIKSGKVAGAAIDVFEKEPTPADHPFHAIDEIITTPHLGASTEEAQEKVASAIAEQIGLFLTTGTIINSVNVHSVDSETMSKIGPYLDLARNMGRFLAQVCPFAISEVEMEYRGEMIKSDLTLITQAAVTGILSHFMPETVNIINAPLLAKERGITVKEIKSSEIEDFASLVTIKAKSNGEKYEISGTIFGKHDARIVRINNFIIEAIPKGNILFIFAYDQPGVIGNIGTTLGKNRINIASMQFGRDKPGGLSVSILHVDNPLPSGIMEDISRLPNIISIKQVEL